MEELLAYANAISPIDSQTIAALSKCFQPMHLRKGDFFVQEGAYAQRIGFLQKGIVRAFFVRHDG